MAQGSQTLFTVKHLSLPPVLSKAIMACFRIARLFHTSCRIAHIQLSVSDTFQIRISNKIYQSFRLNFQLVRPIFMDNPEQNFFLFPLRFPI